MYGEWIRDGIASTESTGDFYEKAGFFVEKVRKTKRVKEVKNNQPILHKDKQGYYTAEIMEQRSKEKIPTTHRCYRISGKPDEIQDTEEITVWLLYFSNQFEELSIGDRVRFKVTKVIPKYFEDIGNCYNLYISNMEKYRSPIGMN